MATAPVAPTIRPTATIAAWHLHLSYIIGIAVLALTTWYGGHVLLQEHDARVQAEATIKVSEAQIKTLQQQIADRDAQAQKQQQVIVKVIHDTTTPQQAVNAMPDIVNVPLSKPVTLDTTGDMVIPPADIIPIFDQLADDKLCRSQLATASADLTDTKAIVVQKDNEIAGLKKKPSFWKRVKSDAEKVGIGMAISAILIH
jgi:hypothetical protein